MVYESADIYISSFTGYPAKIAAVNAIQDALLTSALKAASKGSISQYSLNDGQTIISTTYRNSKEIQGAWMAFESIKQIYINRCIGRVIGMVDIKSINNGRF